MGNHLIDPTSPEFKGKKFTRSWIYGVYGGRVTFYEEMVTSMEGFVLREASAPEPIKVKR
ncbi:MAG: hypothetical protein ACREUB_10830 [Burkholderiales bacterium]